MKFRHTVFQCGGWIVSNMLVPVVEPTRCTSFSSYLFLHNSLHVSDGLSVHHQEFKTVHTATGICQTDTATCLLAGSRYQQVAVSV